MASKFFSGGLTMPISDRLHQMLKASSWVRRMFEEAAELKKRQGGDGVCDFTLGNPVDEPPPSFKEGLKKLALDPKRGMHRYMPNHGFPETRAFVAQGLREETGLPFTEDHIVMTVGAAGGLNIVLKAILDPGDEVIVPTPHFVEFGYYAENHGGRLILAETKEDFSLDPEAIDRRITDRTKAVLVNSPNNPTGVVYPRGQLAELAELLRERSKGRRKPIYLITDDTYKVLLYDGLKPVNTFELYGPTISVCSYSKSLHIPGERIGYVAVNPSFEEAELLMDAFILANRVLGFVNAPALMQRVIPLVAEATVDVADYARRRDTLYRALVDFGYQVVKPQGAFYLFPKTPIDDDVAFVADLQNNYRVLTVPGRGFGKKGHFRISYCVEMEVIERSLERFQQAAKKHGLC